MFLFENANKIALTITINQKLLRFWLRFNFFLLRLMFIGGLYATIQNQRLELTFRFHKTK